MILALFAVVMASCVVARLSAAETGTNPQASKGKSGVAGTFSFRPSGVITLRTRNEGGLNMTERDLNVMENDLSVTQGGLTVSQRAAICFAAGV